MWSGSISIPFSFLHMSPFQPLSLSQGSTVEQNVRLRRGKRQYVLASWLNFDAAQVPALNQRASLCSGLTKMYPEQQNKKTCWKTKLTAVSWPGGLPPVLHVGSKKRICQEVTNKTWSISWAEKEERSFPLEPRKAAHGRSVSPHFSSLCTNPWWLCKC